MCFLTNRASLNSVIFFMIIGRISGIRPAGYPAGYPVPVTGYPAGYRIAKKAGYPAGYPAGRISGATLFNTDSFSMIGV